MSRRRPPGPAEDAQETAEDLQLWAHVARSVERAKLKPRAMPATATPPAGLRRDPSRPPPAGDGTPRPAVRHAPSRPPAPPASRSAPTAPPVEFDRRELRRIGKGQQRIDARLDLHGLTQAEAHDALRHFLHRSEARGHRLVLIITGKGGGGGGGTSTDRSERGVLRRNVPRWLAEPDLRPLVLGCSSATHHGGDGALYVRLRTRR